MTEQPEALRLADEFDWGVARGITIEPRLSAAATELRRLHAENEALRSQLSENSIVQGVPDGWQMVPKEPTPEMCATDFDCDDSIGIDSARICYKAMLASAPPAPQQIEEREAA